MAKYTVKHDPVHNSYDLLYRRKYIASIESVMHRKPGLFRKAQFKWYVRNLPGALDTPFISDKLAIDYAIKQHKMLNDPNHRQDTHPVTKIGRIIDNLGDAVWDASKDPRMATDEHAEAIQNLAISHAKLVADFKKHFKQ